MKVEGNGLKANPCLESLSLQGKIVSPKVWLRPATPAHPSPSLVSCHLELPYLLPDPLLCHPLQPRRNVGPARRSVFVRGDVPILQLAWPAVRQCWLMEFLELALAHSFGLSLMSQTAALGSRWQAALVAAVYVGSSRHPCAQ